MASNVAPIYASQYIRFAETHEVSPAEVFEFRLVALNTGTGLIGFQAAASSATIVTLGVSQSYIPPTSVAPEASRLATVAKSGLLIVEADPANVPAVGDVLLVDTVGRASSAGAAVSIDGTIPTVRSISLTGGRSTVSVSFA